MSTTQATATATQRYAFIHALRGVAALLVVWSHLSGFWLSETGSTSLLQDAWQKFVTGPLHIFQNGGHLGVVLFFLISGFIITHTSLRESRRTFAIRRAMRIFPPLIVATALTWLLVQLATASGRSLISINDGGPLHWLSAGLLLDGFLPGGRALDVTWTLVIEVFFYALTLAALGLTRIRPLRATWILVGAWLLISVASLTVGLLHDTANGSLAPFAAFLLLGRVIYLWHRQLTTGVDAALAGATVVLVYFLLMEFDSPGFLLAPGGWTGFEPIVSYAFAVIAFIVLMRLAPARTVQPLRLLGDVSYSLYLVHLPVGLTVIALLDGIGVPEELTSLAAIVVSIAVAWVSWKLVELPTQRLARRWSRPRPAEATPDAA